MAFWRSQHGPLGSGSPRAGSTHREKRGKKREKREKEKKRKKEKRR